MYDKVQTGFAPKIPLVLRGKHHQKSVFLVTRIFGSDNSANNGCNNAHSRQETHWKDVLLLPILWSS
ncbi:unnamed protein product, partial [Rotaria sp. Silwood2]